MTEPDAVAVPPPAAAPASGAGLGAATVGVLGAGATGARAARHLAGAATVGAVVLGGSGDAHLAALVRSLGDDARVDDPLAVGARAVVLAGPAGTHVEPARHLVAVGCHVVSTSDAIDDVEGLLALDRAARDRDVSVVVGAGFAPGLSDVLAVHVAGWMDTVDEVHVARFGTGGPSCARQHHRALSARSLDRRDGEWDRRSGGSGRELCVFPEPVGSVDCYRAGLPDALLLHAALPAAQRLTARQAANRRDRLTAWAPMLRRPHPEGRVGAIRVEVRGWRDGVSVTEVVGAIDRPAVAAGAVAGLAARWLVEGRHRGPGAAGLASMVEPLAFLRELAVAGVRAARFLGS